MTGTGAVALAVAAAIPGTLVSRILGEPRSQIRFGHPSGVLAVGAEACEADDGEWSVTKAVVSRSARRLMDGYVFVPAP
jgi:2-methylaconitate cis-trans-isomerase PrpF